MKNLKKIALLLACLSTAYSMYAMEETLVKYNTLVEESVPARDRQELEQILKDNWSSHVWGEQGKTFDKQLADNMLNHNIPAPDTRFISLIREKAIPNSPITAYAVYSLIGENPNNPDTTMREKRGYLEMVAFKDMTPNEKRKILETTLIGHAVNKLRDLNSEKINTYTHKNDDFEIGLLQKAGFTQVKEGKEWRLFEFPLKK